MRSLARAPGARLLACLTLVLIVAAPFVTGIGHDDHDGEHCPICKLGQTAAVGIEELAHGESLERLARLTAESTAPATVHRPLEPFAPRGPPA